MLGYMCLLLELWFSQGMRPVVEFLGHMVGYSWLFEEISILFSTAAVWEKFLKKS